MLGFSKKLIDTLTASNFYLKFKENNENGMTFCYISCLGLYCLRLTSMAALQLLMPAPCHQMILILQILIQSVDFH